jgi:hypothetical protein
MNIFDLNKPQDRWLMYFTEPSLFDRISKEEYERYSEICEALESVEAKNFSPEKIYGYELYVDSIRQYHTTMSLERKAGHKEGRTESIQIIEELKRGLLSPEDIASKFNTELDFVMKLKELT